MVEPGIPSPRVMVVVPAWNEGPIVGRTVREIRSASPEYDVVVVDDGSDDATGREAESAGARVVALPFNIGVGGAMRTGFLLAQREGYDVVVQVDADGQHDPADVARVVGGLADADISIGARFAGVGTYSVGGPRWWAMKLLASALSRIAGTKLTDVTSGFRAANTRAIAQYVRYYPSEYLGDTLDSLVAALENGLRVTQVPVAMRPRQHGSSSQSPIGATVYLLRAMFALALSLLRRPFLTKAVSG